MPNISRREKALIRAAATAVERAMKELFEGQESVPGFSPAEFEAMSRQEQEEALDSEVAAYRRAPELAALHFCLTSSSCLLEVSRSLVEEPQAQFPAQDAGKNVQIENAKAAGRAAYRAALILSDFKRPLH